METNYKEMLRTSETALDTAGVLNRLVKDYLSDKNELREFYEFYPELSGFKALLKKDPFTSINRKLLTEVLKKQASRLKNTSPRTLKNIEELSEASTYTVTTGHQVCLFTGPLYFIYKIYSAINLAEQLTKENPGKKFVPVYWMATEDHDFEEVNHFYVNGKKIEWTSTQTGAVGNFKTAELKDLLPSIKDAVGISERSKYLVDLFESAYLKNPDLATATHYLVNELFGDKGLVVIDANDRDLKKEFQKEMEADLFQHAPEATMTPSAKKLEEMGYNAQVHARQINCFYMEDGLRARIERDGTQFKIVGTDKTFSDAELKALIGTNPEKISPNVVLRPLYQQKILPNVAYIGGPGELAYWLEMFEMFKGFDIQFPILVPRTFATLIDEPTRKKTEQLNIKLDDVFKSEQELLLAVQKDLGKTVRLEEQEKKIKELFIALTAQITAIDTTLEKAVKANEHRALKGLNRLEQKANRALRASLETEKNRIAAIRSKLFPNGQPQERIVNFSEFYLMHGSEFLKTVAALAQPLDQKMKLLLA